jgi:hypothetical protein
MISVLGSIAQAIKGRTELPKHVCLFYRKDGYSVGEVELDLILDEHHSKDAEVTENPLQDGRAVSDGIYLKLRDGSLTGLVSNHSLKHATPPDIQSAEALLEQAESYTLENRAKQAWEDLKGVMDRKELVTIVTALEVYENVAITHIETDRDGGSGDALEIKISFKQVQTVKLKEDKVSLAMQPEDMNSEINRSASVNIDNGQTVGAEITESEREQLYLGVQ